MVRIGLWLVLFLLVLTLEMALVDVLLPRHVGTALVKVIEVLGAAALATYIVRKKKKVERRKESRGVGRKDGGEGGRDDG